MNEFVEALPGGVPLANDGLPESWSPGSLDDVEKALRTLERGTAEWARVQEQAVVWRAEIDAWAADQCRPLVASASYLVNVLERWAISERVRSGGKVKSWKLPSGSVSTSQGRDSVEIEDEAVLLAWCRENLPAAVKVVESVLKKPLLDGCAVADGDLIFGAGEIVPGARVVSGASKISASVTVASNRELPRGA